MYGPPESNAPGNRGGERCCGGEALVSSQDLVLPSAVSPIFGLPFHICQIRVGIIG